MCLFLSICVFFPNVIKQQDAIETQQRIDQLRLEFAKRAAVSDYTHTYIYILYIIIIHVHIICVLNSV